VTNKNWPKIYVSTYDASVFIVPTFAYLFNKYWGEDQEIILLCYSKPKVKLPKNFQIVSMGKDPGADNWTGPQYKILKKLVKDDYLIYMLDDELPIDFLKPNIFDDLFGKMKADPTVGRVGMGFGPSLNTGNFKLIERKQNYDIFELNQDAPYRITSQCSLWRSDYFFKHMVEPKDAWMFELRGSEAAKNDGRRVLGTARQHPFRWIEHGAISRRNNGKINLLGLRLDDVKEIVVKKLLDKDLIQFGQDRGPLYSKAGLNFKFDDVREFKNARQFHDLKSEYGDLYGERQSPPMLPPTELIDSFSLGRRAAIVVNYFDSCYKDPIFYEKGEIEQNVKKVKKRELGRYGETDKWLYQALDKYPIDGKTVANMGSTSGFYEAVCLAYGSKPITIEYNVRGSNHPKLKFLTPQEYDKNPIIFDAAMSISSFEHDGLGRYGDAIDPFADFKAMDKMRKMIKKGGWLFLAVPIGVDKVIWNAHRVYGGARLPLLLAGWRVLDTVGFDRSLLTVDLPGLDVIQPVFVLENT